MIPVCNQILPDESINNIIDCAKSGWITNGNFVNNFESQWAKYCGKDYGVAVNNGSSALELALRVLKLPEGSEVIMPSFTIISCAIAAIRNNLIPVLVDVDPATWCIDPLAVSMAVTNKTRAIMPVHMFGHPADMRTINSIAKARNLIVIEDAAQAHGAECVIDDELNLWAKCGGIGDLACFSFYNNKIITTGEGGMVLTDNKELYERLRSYRNLCFGNGADRFKHNGIGSNFRLTNLQASMAGPQIDNIDNILISKARISNLYREHLNHPSVIHQQISPLVKSAHWMHAVVTNKPSNHVINKMKSVGIETRPLFHGLHKQPIKYLNIAQCDYSHTDWLSEYGLYLPSGVDLSLDNIKYISNALLNILES